jgi:hypothetical protein
MGLELKGNDMADDFDNVDELDEPTGETEPTVPVMLPIEPGQSGTDSGQELSNPVQGAGPKPPISMGWVARGDA